MLSILLYFNLIFVPVYCVFRLIRNGKFVFLNPCFYILIFSYFYLTVSSLFFEQAFQFLKFSSTSITTTNFLCNWFTLVFFLFYVSSLDRKLLSIDQFKPKKITVQIAFILTVISSLIFLFIIIFNASELLELYGKDDSLISRSELASSYEEIYEIYRISNLKNILLASSTVLIWQSKNFIWYLPLVIPIILGLLTNSRGIIVACIAFAYINYILITKKSHLFKISMASIFVTLLAFARQGENIDFIRKLQFSLFGEFIYTRITTTITYDHFMGKGDIGNYLIDSLAKLLPGAVAKILFQYVPEDYVNVIKDFYSEYYGIDFGLVGNMVSESLYYGGIFFALLSPIIIGGTFFCLNKLRFFRTFPGLILFSFIVSDIPQMMRLGFYNRFLILVYLMASYILWLSVLEWGRFVLKSQVSAPKKSFVAAAIKQSH